MYIILCTYHCTCCHARINLRYDLLTETRKLQNLMAPNLTAIAKDFGFNDEERDRKLGGEIALGFFILGAPVALLAGYLTDLTKVTVPRRAPCTPMHLHLYLMYRWVGIVGSIVLIACEIVWGSCRV